MLDYYVVVKIKEVELLILVQKETNMQDSRWGKFHQVAVQQVQTETICTRSLLGMDKRMHKASKVRSVSIGWGPWS